MGRRHMVQAGDLGNAYAFQFQLQGLNPKLCHTLVFLFSVCQKVKGFYHIYLRMKIVRWQDWFPVCQQFPLVAYSQIGKPALPETHLPAVGEQAVTHNPFGISGEPGTHWVIGGRRMAQPDAALLIEIFIPKCSPAN